MKTTAQIRNEAYEAEKALNWNAAAELYEQAIAAYPSHHAGSQIAIADKKMLQRKADCCKAMAA